MHYLGSTERESTMQDKRSFNERRVQQMIRQGSPAATPDSSQRPGPTALELEVLESLHRYGKTHISLSAIREELD